MTIFLEFSFITFIYIFLCVVCIFLLLTILTYSLIDAISCCRIYCRKAYNKYFFKEIHSSSVKPIMCETAPVVVADSKIYPLKTDEVSVYVV